MWVDEREEKRHHGGSTQVELARAAAGGLGKSRRRWAGAGAGDEVVATRPIVV